MSMKTQGSHEEKMLFFVFSWLNEKGEVGEGDLEIAMYVIHKGWLLWFVGNTVDGGNPKQPPGMVLKSCQ